MRAAAVRQQHGDPRSDTERDQRPFTNRGQEAICRVWRGPRSGTDPADVHGPSESILRRSCDLIEFVTVGGPNDEHVDVGRDRTGFPEIARGPRPVDEGKGDAIDVGQQVVQHG